jgi:CRP-like cAMP-binding protein
MTVVDGAITREWLLGQGRRNALQRIAHLLCEIDARLRDVGQSSNGYFTLPVTQVELGDMLGLSAVHTNRVLQELRSRKLITWSGHSVQILDADGLCGLAEFDADYLAPVGAKSATMEST